MKVLFIGNSYTFYNEMPKLLEAIAAGNGKALETHQVTKGGWYLHKYLDEQNEFQDKLMALIAENHYDACFLQEQSMCPFLAYDRFADGANRLMKRMEGVVDEFVLYQTWARKEGSPSLEKHSLTAEEFAEGIVLAYEKLGKEAGIRVSPVGRNFAAFRKVDGETELYNEDKSHPSYAGSCLAALRHYKTLFGEVPGDTSMLELPEDVRARMCKVVSEN